MKFDDYNSKLVDSMHERWLNPLDDIEDSQTCYSCYGISEYEILGRSYCRMCARTEFIDLSVDEAMCEFCGNVVDTCFDVAGDRYCEDCFDSTFRI